MRFAAACHTGAYFPLIVSLQSGVQSRRSFTVYDIQSHHVTFFQFDVQSHFSSCRHSGQPSLFSCGIQSHHRFSVSAFRAIITFSVRRSESSSSLLSFGIQSHHCSFLVSAFRAIIGFQIDIQSRYHFSASAFRAIIGFQIDIQSHTLGFGVQSRYHSSASVFRAIVITVCSVRRSEPSSVFRSTFRVVITSQLRRSEPSSDRKSVV